MTPALPRIPGMAAVLSVFITLAGCTSSAQSGPTPSAQGTASLATATTAIPGSAASTPVSTAPEPSTSAARSSASTPSTSSTPTPTAPTPTGPPACTTAQLTVRALRGGAVAGREIALITFTNKGGVCSLFGFPGVSLRLHNVLLGKPAERMGTPSTVTLQPGAQAEAGITDFSSCQAPVSDTVRVYPPNQRAFTDRPLALRACRVVVNPVKHS